MSAGNTPAPSPGANILGQLWRRCSVGWTMGEEMLNVGPVMPKDI